VHELAIAGAIVEIASKHARGRRVVSVEVRIGHLRQVVPGALEFSFELVAEGTPVEGAELRIEDVPARVACRDCAEETRARAFPLVCASCGSLTVDVIAGDELLVEALELEDEPIAVLRR
jgi:hydrogenase nickel incorporation protein HypA/HybF